MFPVQLGVQMKNRSSHCAHNADRPYFWRITGKPEVDRHEGSRWIASALPTSCQVTRRFRGCECYDDLSPTIRQNGERRALGECRALYFVKRMMRHRI